MFSRKIILNHYQAFLNLPITMVTLCVFGKTFSDGVARFLENNASDVFVYHQKGERVFTKSYPKDSTSGSLLELISGQNQPLMLHKADFTYAINDPYYLKPVSALDFETLLAIPVFGKEGLKGAALIYSSKELDLNQFPESFFGGLIDELLEEEEKEMLSTFNLSLLEHYHPCYAIVDKVSGRIYQSPSLNDVTGSLPMEAQMLQLPETVLGGIRYQVTRVEHDSYAICFFDSMSKAKTSDIHIFEDLFLIKAPEVSLLGACDRNQSDGFAVFHDKVKAAVRAVTDLEPVAYQYHSHALVFAFEKMIDRRILTSLGKAHPECRFELIRVGREIPSRQDLVKVCSYMLDHINDSFSYENYLDFRKKQEEEAYYESLIAHHPGTLVFRPMENTRNHDAFGFFVSLKCNNLLIDESQMTNMELGLSYHRELLKLLGQQPELPGMVFPALSVRDLTTSGLLDLLSRLDERFPGKIGIFIHEVGMPDKKQLARILSNLRKKGYFLLANDQIFANLNLFELMEHSDGLVISRDVFHQIDKGEENLLTQFINHYLDKQKVVVFKDLYEEELGAIPPRTNVFVTLMPKKPIAR
jgi:hypothetical protein